MTFCGHVNFLLCVIISKADHKDLLSYSHSYWSYGAMTLDSYKVPTFQSNKIFHVRFMYRTVRFNKQEAVNGEPIQLEIFFLIFLEMWGCVTGSQDDEEWSSWKMTTTCDLHRRPKLRVTLSLALAGAALLTCTRIPRTASAKTKKGAVRLWHCSRTESGWFITCTHTGCARRRTARWARASCRRSSSAAYRSENELFRSTPRRPGGEVWVCRPDTSMVSVLVSEGTHSRASSVQQPPHRLKDTQDGTKRLCVSPGSSRHTSTRVSRGSHPLREYTSSHRLTGEDMGLRICLFIRQPFLFQVIIRGEKRKAYLLGLPWISETLLAASERAWRETQTSLIVFRWKASLEWLWGLRGRLTSQIRLETIYK